MRVWPLVFVVPIAWLTALLTAAGQRPFWLGVVLGVAGYGPMLLWIAEPAGALAWVLLVGIQAAFVGLASVLVWPWLRHGAMPLIAAVAWTGVDLLRSWVPLNGFEWGALQYGHVEGSWMLPLARIGGGRAITLLTVFLAAALVHVVVEAAGGADGTSPRPAVRPRLRQHRTPVLLLVGGLLFTAIVRIGPPPATGQTLDVLIAQGNDIEERTGTAREEDFQIASNLLEVTRLALEGQPIPDLVVWPENALDRDPWAPEGEDLLPIVEEAAAMTNGRLLAGVNRVGPREDSFQNSQVLVGIDGLPIDLYVKRHYVPFGEYVPWRSVLGGFPPLRKVPRDGIPEPVTDTIHVDEARIAVAICFESLFGRLIRENVRAGERDANLIVISTSDSTFGRSGEAEQHLSQSRLRAVESGRWIVHAASSGITTLIAPDGSVGERTELFTQAIQRHDVPLIDASTPWLRWGDLLDLVLGPGTLLLAATAIRRRRPRSAADVPE